MKSVVIINDDEGKSIGFVFVKIDLHDNAKMAIESLNGADIDSIRFLDSHTRVWSSSCSKTMRGWICRLYMFFFNSFLGACY